MDGSGKSTLADTIRRHLEQGGEPVEPAWIGLASDGRLLDRLAMPLKRVLRPARSTADPAAALDPSARRAAAPTAAGAAGRTGVVARGWIVVAGLTARGLRRAGRRRRAGATVLCDRWLTDALVDLELRYGRHRAAEALLARLAPRVDLALLLTVEAETAGRRKPGDRAPAVLERMKRLYARNGARTGATVLDGRRGADVVSREALALVDALR